MNASPDRSGYTEDGRANLEDWRGVGDMIAITTARVAAPVEGVHRAIIDRWFRLAGPKAEPLRLVVDGLTALTYRTVRFGGSAVGATVSVASEAASGRVSLRPVWETSRGRYVQSILNGVWGDHLEDEKSRLRIDLALRDLDGSRISPSRASLGRAFPDPTNRLVVLLHGFAETERCWRSNQTPTLVEGLEADGFSVLCPRYNTGRRVTDSGSDLAELLEAVREAWPAPVEEIVLIGHSMGGLVAQSAVQTARSSGYRWADLTTHLVAIGAPHRGSPIEKGVETISKGLGLFKETRPLAEFVAGRSGGIKDLRHGSDSRPERVRYHVVAGAVTTRPTHPLGVLVGDLVVRVDSALGGHRSEVGSGKVLVVGGRHHAGLLRDPEVTACIRRWLDAGRGDASLLRNRR